jgi:hypothetical protein
MSNRTIHTDVRAYVSDQREEYPIRINITQTIWAQNGWDIIGQSGHGVNATIEETEAIIAELQKTLEEARA